MTNFEKYVANLKTLSPKLEEIRQQYLILQREYDAILGDFQDGPVNLTLDDIVVGSIGMDQPDTTPYVLLFGHKLPIDHAAKIKNWITNLLTETPDEFINIR